ncbi:hypothetical protein [Escherichia coli]|uniref:hypothetical protein n=3 Tax=Escherichia coli TaxID=562 RepID=UPI0024121D5F|nr:hypothetical protein [Escherichia coli]
MSNAPTIKSGNADLLHAEATPHGVNIMTRNDAGGYEQVAIISYESAVNGLDAGEYDDKPGIGYAIHFAVADGGARGWFDFTAQHNVTMWRWLIAATFISEMKRENGTTTVDQVCRDMVISLAGIVAQSRYTGDDINALMETSGKADMKNVRDLSEVYRVAGGEDADIQRISLSRAEALIALKWWDVIALAKILENRNHMPARNFQRIMGDIDKPVPKPMTLAELDELVGEE